jgi:hypothetical protein
MRCNVPDHAQGTKGGNCALEGYIQSEYPGKSGSFGSLSREFFFLIWSFDETFALCFPQCRGETLHILPSIMYKGPDAKTDYWGANFHYPVVDIIETSQEWEWHLRISFFHAHFD